MPGKNIPKNRLIDVVPEVRIKFKDIFDMKEFYEALYHTLAEYGWTSLYNDNKIETYYGERIAANGGKEMWIMWRVYKKAPETPYLTYYFDLDYHLINLLPTEVVKDGKKIKLHKGECELKVKASIEENYKEEFEKHPILRYFLGIFQRRIYSSTIDQRKKELYQEIYAITNFMRQWFKLKRYLPYEETKSFFPSYAWPSHLKE